MLPLRRSIIYCEFFSAWIQRDQRETCISTRTTKHSLIKTQPWENKLFKFYSSTFESLGQTLKGSKIWTIFPVAFLKMLKWTHDGRLHTVPCCNVYLSVSLATIQPLNHPLSIADGLLTLFLLTADLTCYLSEGNATLPNNIRETPQKFNSRTGIFKPISVKKSFCISSPYFALRL